MLKFNSADEDPYKRKSSKIIINSLLSIVFAVLPTKSTLAQGWWKSKWKVRRTIVYKPKDNREGFGCAVTFLTGGKLRPDGGDIRVIGPGSKVLKHRILRIGPGDIVSIVFDAKGKAEKKYYIYYGNPEAKTVEDTEWLPKGGLLLESFKYSGGSLGNANSLKRTVERAKDKPIGKAYINAIFIPGNLFSDDKRTCNKYSGWLVCKRSGEYEFVISTIDGSALFIDGELVVAWPGRHWWVGDIRHRGKITLKAGMHRFEFYHVNFSGKAGAVVGWKTPASGAIRILDSKAFLPIVRGYLKSLQIKGKTSVADFVYRRRRFALMEKSGLYEYEFIAVDPFSVRKGKAGGGFTWQFGDGQVGLGNPITHIFLHEGIYPVTLERRLFGRTSIITNRIFVGPNRADFRARPVRLRSFEKTIAGYDFSSMSLKEIEYAMEYFLTIGNTDLAIKAGREKIMSAGKIDKNEVKKFSKIVNNVSKLLVQKGQYLDSAELLIKSADKIKDQKKRKEMLIKVCYVYINYLGNATEADKILKQIPLTDKIKDEIDRSVVMIYGDLARVKGNRDEAEKYYKMITKIGKDYYLKTGAYTSAIEDYLRRREFEKAEELIEKWEWEYPIDKIDGYVVYLRYKLYKLKGQKDQAALIAKITHKIAPFSVYCSKMSQ